MSESVVFGDGKLVENGAKWRREKRSVKTEGENRFEGRYDNEVINKSIRSEINHHTPCDLLPVVCTNRRNLQKKPRPP